MKTSFKLANPNEIKITMSFTMKLKDWAELRNQFDQTEWPACDMRDEIDSMVNQAEIVFLPKQD